MKPYMVDNLRQFLEREMIVFPESDEELYMQLISYVVVRTTATGRPVFEAGGSAMDHAHDALMLALLAVTENYGDLNKMSVATNTGSFSNQFYMPIANDTSMDSDSDDKYDKKKILTSRVSAIGASSGFKRRPGTSVKRSMF
jgi:hypothetical protein